MRWKALSVLNRITAIFFPVRTFTSSKMRVELAPRPGALGISGGGRGYYVLGYDWYEGTITSVEV